jgi:hypothetical protein
MEFVEIIREDELVKGTSKVNNNLFLMFLLLILIENSKEDRFSELNLTYK